MWTEADREQIVSSGRDPDLAAQQLALLAGPPPSARLVRAATVGDGIHLIRAEDASALEAAADEAAAAGRVTLFVPASGAATRMSEALLRAWRGGALSAAEQAVVDAVIPIAPALALWPELAARGAVAGHRQSTLDALFGPSGIGLDRAPKGLVPFHHSADGARTPFVEHLAEGLSWARPRGGALRAHFTVAVEHAHAFKAALDAARARLDGPVDVGFSFQEPRTDTIAADGAGGPFRTDDGRLLFRPGGHGALLHNLDALRGDVIVVRNVDNVAPEADRAEAVLWRRRMVGALVWLVADAHQHVRALRAGADPTEARMFAARWLGEAPGEAAALADGLDRPWRVAGMVKNQGQPGGGPFWAEGPDGVSLQIVESAQVAADLAQQEILRRATHFNPVDLALCVRRADGEAHDLAGFTDPGAVFVSHKSSGGKALRALEHPGLWNGQMARWNTVFVEIPASVFRPVKTMADLLGRAHGGPLGG